MRNQRITVVVCVVLAWLSGLLALPFLPDPAPIHWDVNGRPDDYGNPLIAAFLLPLILTALAVALPLLPKIDPRGEGYAGFAGTFRRFNLAIVIFLFAVHVAVLLAGLGVAINMGRPILAGVGMLYAILGNEMGRVQPNFFVGIRTPWTLADDEVWRRTHRVSGRAMLVGGVVTVLAAMLLPVPLMIYLALPVIILSALYGVVYSYVCYRSLRNQRSVKG